MSNRIVISPVVSHACENLSLSLREEQRLRMYKNTMPRNTRWFKYDQDHLCVNKSQFVPVIFEPPCIFGYQMEEV
jgi:hypothetical protein